MWQWVARGNIQQISYIPQTEQHSPFGLMLLRLGNVTTMCVCVCVACGMWHVACGVCVGVCGRETSLSSGGGGNTALLW